MSLHREDLLAGCIESCIESMAFKREKLHQNPSRDMTFGSIRATTCQACLVSPARTGHRADRAVPLAPCRSNGNRADRTVPLEREPCRSHRAEHCRPLAAMHEIRWCTGLPEEGPGAASSTGASPAPTTTSTSMAVSCHVRLRSAGYHSPLTAIGRPAIAKNRPAQPLPKMSLFHIGLFHGGITGPTSEIMKSALQISSHLPRAGRSV